MKKNNANPELTDTDFERAKPFAEVFPMQHTAWRKRERPVVAKLIVHISFWLAAEVAEGIRATGRRYNTRVERMLQEALRKRYL